MKYLQLAIMAFALHAQPVYGAGSEAPSVTSEPDGGEQTAALPEKTLEDEPKIDPSALEVPVGRSERYIRGNLLMNSKMLQANLMKQKFSLEARAFAVKSAKWRAGGGTMVGLGVLLSVAGAVTIFLADTPGIVVGAIMVGVGIAMSFVGGLLFIRGAYKWLSRAVKAYNMSSPDEYILPGTGQYRVTAGEPI